MKRAPNFPTFFCLSLLCINDDFFYYLDCNEGKVSDTEELLGRQTPDSGGRLAGGAACTTPPPHQLAASSPSSSPPPSRRSSSRLHHHHHHPPPHQHLNLEVSACLFILIREYERKKKGTLNDK